MSPFHYASEIAKLYNFEALKELIAKAEAAYEDMDSAAISLAKSITETVCKEILSERGEALPDRFPQLVKQALRAVKCNDEQISGSLSGLANSVGTFRNNNVQDAHGGLGNDQVPTPKDIVTYVATVQNLLTVLHAHLTESPAELKDSKLPFESAEDVYELEHTNAYIDRNAEIQYDEDEGVLFINGQELKPSEILYRHSKAQYVSDVESTNRVLEDMLIDQATNLINDELTDHRFDNFFPGHYGYEFPEIWIDEIQGDRNGKGEITCTGSVSTTATLMSSKDGVDLDYSSGFSATLTIHRSEDGAPQLELNELNLELNDWWAHEEEDETPEAAEPAPMPMAEPMPAPAARAPLAQLSPNLPSIRNLSGTCWIYIPETGETQYTLNQKKILKRLWPCHGEEPMENRQFVIGRSDEKITIELSNARLFVTHEACSEFCAAIDTMMPEYLAALRQMEKELDAEGFYFDTLDNSEDIILGEVTSELWTAMHDFAAKRDYESGDSPWHIFDGHSPGIKIYHKADTERFDHGFQAIVDISEVHRDSMRDPHTPGDVELRWDPRLNLDGGPPGKRKNWSPATIVAWLTDEFIPVVKEEYGLSEHHDFTDYREWDKCELSPTPTDEDLIRAVNFIQARYHSISTDDLFHVPSNLAQEIMKHLVLFLQKGNLPSLEYISNKLLSRRAQSIQEMIAAILSLSEEIGNEQRDASWIEHLFRAIGDALERGKPDLTEEERKSFIQALEPFFKQLDELILVKRHLREFH